MMLALLLLSSVANSNGDFIYSGAISHLSLGSYHGYPPVWINLGLGWCESPNGGPYIKDYNSGWPQLNCQKACERTGCNTVDSPPAGCSLSFFNVSDCKAANAWLNWVDHCDSVDVSSYAADGQNHDNSICVCNPSTSRLSPDGQSCIEGSQDPCAVFNVSGKWQGQFSVAAPSTITFKYGTTKSKDASKTTTWSKDVSAHVESGFKIFGFGGKASVDGHVGQSIENLYSTDWQMNEEEDFEIAFQSSDVGKFVWQFNFAVDDACESGANPISKEYALTGGAWEEPCCIPGYCVDAPQCDICYSAEFMIPGAEQPRCRTSTTTTTTKFATGKPQSLTV